MNPSLDPIRNLIREGDLESAAERIYEVAGIVSEQLRVEAGVWAARVHYLHKRSRSGTMSNEATLVERARIAESGLEFIDIIERKLRQAPLGHLGSVTFNAALTNEENPSVVEGFELSPLPVRSTRPAEHARSHTPPLQVPSTKKHVILFLAANPKGTDPRALDREVHSIQEELERSGYREHFEFKTRWAAQPLDLLRELRKLKPTVVHYSGHGSTNGLYFQAADGNVQIVRPAALAETFSAAGKSVKLVILDACYDDAQAEALLAHVDFVVGMGNSIHGDAARSFAIGFYGGIGERESVSDAYKQGCAAMSLEGMNNCDRPQLKVSPRADANQRLFQ